jgi:hypothetical protein
MIVYNHTVLVDWAIAPEWLAWKRVQQKEIMNTGLFYDSKMYRLLEQDDSQGPTYIIQYFAATPDDYLAYRSSFATAFEKKEKELWQQGLASFHTLMEVVN